MMIAPLGIELSKAPKSAASRRAVRILMLHHLLAQIAKNPSLSDNLVLQGGGAMHFAYLGPRLSSDIDFVRTNTSKMKASDLVGELAQLDSSIEGYSLRIKVKKNEGNLVRVSWNLENEGSFRPSVSVEAYLAAAPILGVQTAQIDGNMIQVETPREIAADKLVANYDRIRSRGMIKISDIFDLAYLCQFIDASVGPDLFEKKAHAYALETSPDKVDKYMGDFLSIAAASETKLRNILATQAGEGYARLVSWDHILEQVQQIVGSLRSA